MGRSAARPFYVVRRLTLGPRWVNGKDSSQLKLSWLVPTALVLAVNGCLASLTPAGLPAAGCLRFATARAAFTDDYA